MSRPIACIALEEHCLTGDLFQETGPLFQEQVKAIPDLRSKIEDLGDWRITDMDEGHINVQVISHACGLGAARPEMCQEANDKLAEAVQKHPDRFAGFALLPLLDPNESAKELERSVKRLGFVGALVDSQIEGRFFDGPEWDVLWRMAENVDVPIYLHPTWPADSMVSQYAGHFTGGAERSLGASGWGWHTTTGLHVLRLFAAGIFDRYPKLKIIVGHFGEMLPFQLERLFKLSPRWGERQRTFKQVWDENVFITTSGVWSLNPLRCLLGNTRIDHILFSVDWPFESNTNGRKWLEELADSALVTAEEVDMIAYKNAESLLGIRARR